MRKETLVLREIADEAFDSSSHLRYRQSAHQFYIFELPASSLSRSIAATYHGILAHEYNSLNISSLRPQTLAYFVHLLRADIVDRHDKDRLVPNFL